MSEHNNDEQKTKKEPDSLNDGGSKTNPTPHSEVHLNINHVEFNIFFDGTWNSKKNSDHYNNAANREKADFKDAKKQKKFYNLGTSFARAPTGVDQMHRASIDNDHCIISLYVDGAGTVTWGEDHKWNKAPKKDAVVGASFGWMSTGVEAKLSQMFEQIRDKLDALHNTKQLKFNSIMFNVYGFSRGAATARIFCNRVIHKKIIPFNTGVDEDRIQGDITHTKWEKLDLSPYIVTLKMVGLFDTVSSIGGNHENDVEGNDQSLDFKEGTVTGKIVHILAGHEFRQKFAITSIQTPVEKGYGFELVMPGCHTDIGDGLNSEVKYDVKNDKWGKKGEEERTVILQKYRVFKEGDKTKLPPVFPLAALPVGYRERQARKEVSHANFEEIRSYLIQQDWYTDTEIKIEKNITLEKMKVERVGLNFHYPKIPTFIMLELIKKNGAYHFDEGRLDKYKIEKTDDADIQAMYADFKTQALALYDKNEKKYVKDTIEEGLQNSAESKMPYIDVTDAVLRQKLYNKCLHWCSSMGGWGSVIAEVNIPHMNNKTNRFYRKVVQG